MFTIVFIFVTFTDTLSRKVIHYLSDSDDASLVLSFEVFVVLVQTSAEQIPEQRSFIQTNDHDDSSDLINNRPWVEG